MVVAVEGAAVVEARLPSSDEGVVVYSDDVWRPQVGGADAGTQASVKHVGAKASHRGVGGEVANGQNMCVSQRALVLKRQRDALKAATKLTEVARKRAGTTQRCAAGRCGARL